MTSNSCNVFTAFPSLLSLAQFARQLGGGAVTERLVKCKQSQGHVTGSEVSGSTWIMFHLS